MLTQADYPNLAEKDILKKLIELPTLDFDQQSVEFEHDAGRFTAQRSFPKRQERECDEDSPLGERA